MKENRSVTFFCYYYYIEWMKICKSTNVWKKNRSIIISCYHFYVIWNRMRFLFHSDLTHLILISWNCDLISSHRMRAQSHLIPVSCHPDSVSSHRMRAQFHLILISCCSDSDSSHLMKIWSHLISFHKIFVSSDLISSKFLFCLISSQRDLISSQFHIRTRWYQNEIFQFWQSV